MVYMITWLYHMQHDFALRQLHDLLKPKARCAFILDEHVCFRRQPAFHIYYVYLNVRVSSPSELNTIKDISTKQYPR